MTDVRQHHVRCARCGKHLLIVGLYVSETDTLTDSWGGMLFDDPGPVCDCCLGDCVECKQ